MYQGSLGLLEPGRAFWQPNGAAGVFPGYDPTGPRPPAPWLGPAGPAPSGPTMLPAPLPVSVSPGPVAVVVTDQPGAVTATKWPLVALGLAIAAWGLWRVLR